MWHPFQSVGVRDRKRLMRVVGVLTAISGIGILLVDNPTHNDTAPLGQVSLQFAGTTERATEIVASWADVLPYAGGSVGIDYLWMLSYSTLLMLGCAWVAHRGRGTVWATVGALGGIAATLALVLDAIEGVLLFQILDDPAAGNPGLIRVVATVKFLAIAVSLGVWIAGGLATRRAVAARS
ncbi:MAG: hypothetical protein ACR2N7_09930 [Acidimicrobiia bacterium]